MIVKDMKYVSKVISKLYAVENGSNVVVAEVIENPGCGFDYLVRIKPEYKYELNIFSECLKLCGLSNISISKDFIEKSIEREFVYCNEDIALVIDEIV